MKYITLEWLEKHGACRVSREVFLETFGTKALVNLKNAKKAYKSSLYLYYVSDYLFKDNLITKKQLNEFDTIWNDGNSYSDSDVAKAWVKLVKSVKDK